MSTILNAFASFVFRMKDGVELTKDSAASKYRFKKDGKRHILIINDVTKEDIGTYFAMTNGGESKAELEVEGNPWLLSSFAVNFASVAILRSSDFQ